MARSASVNSANSQFFIVLADATYLDGKYTAFGNVLHGMSSVDSIKKGNPENNGIVAGKPDRMIRVYIASDATEEQLKELYDQYDKSA